MQKNSGVAAYAKKELALMSRGTLELIAHYRSDIYLVKEHRIRMEVPGLPIFEKDGKQTLGIALQDPQLDS